MKLWAPGHPHGCHIGLTDGTTFFVPHDKAGAEVPARSYRVAVGLGCLPVGMEPEEAEPDTVRRATMIGEAARNAMANAIAPAGMRGQPATSRPTGLDSAVLARPEMTSVAAATVRATIAVPRDPTADRILQRLRQTGNAGLTRTDISDVFKRNLSAKRIGAALELLRGNGRATCETVSTAGRPTEVWRATESTVKTRQTK